MAEGKTLGEVNKENGDLLLKCDSAINIWCNYFRIPENNES